MAVTVTTRDELLDVLARLGVTVSAEQGVFDALFTSSPVEDKPEIAALTTITTPDGSDPATTQTLANACKAKINQIIAALQA